MGAAAAAVQVSVQAGEVPDMALMAETAAAYPTLDLGRHLVGQGDMVAAAPEMELMAGAAAAVAMGLTAAAMAAKVQTKIVHSQVVAAAAAMDLAAVVAADTTIAAVRFRQLREAEAAVVAPGATPQVELLGSP